MAETLSPNPTPAQKQRVTVLSPVSTFFLGSNNDKLERAQARAARAASIRRKPVTVNSAADANSSDHFLSQEQIMELFQNCIKLASENKINQKNTWELNLIDHMFDIVKVEVENDVETNFQKASCTLEAGVKIYSARVDSVHSEAYKVLGGINRAGQDLEQDSLDDGNTDSEQGKQNSKEQERKLSPLSTLESSFDTLNVKRFDVAFSVDPLYHQMSAQFDEGGAKGLLLNNLGVYGGCRVLFDSLEVPGKCMSCSLRSDNKAETIDISHAKDCLEQMVINIPKNNQISPSLRDIVNMFDENNSRPPDTFSFAHNSVEPDYEANDEEYVDNQHENRGTWDFVNDNNTSPDDGTYDGEEEPFIPNYDEENNCYVSRDLDVDNRFLRVEDFLFLRLGFTSRQNAWAGPEHWKYQRAKGPDVHAKENGSPLFSKKPRNKKQAEVDIEFVKALENDVLDPFAPQKNPKSLLLPTNREPCDMMLPEDCHYQPEDLVKLFLVPNVMCLGKRARRHTDELRHQEEADGACPSWDDDCGVGDQYDNANTYDAEDSSTLISQPRQVEKVEVQYDKKSKQVDVHVLKETLWSSMQEMQKSVQEETLSFKNILVSFPADNKRPAASSIDDISSHLCFICILHLANEHGLSIHGTENLDDLSIHLPSHTDVL